MKGDKETGISRADLPSPADPSSAAAALPLRRVEAGFAAHSAEAAASAAKAGKAEGAQNSGIPLSPIIPLSPFHEPSQIRVLRGEYAAVGCGGAARMLGLDVAHAVFRQLEAAINVNVALLSAFSLLLRR
ncbi:MAG: hypothetical protein ACE5JZ_07450 [Kiloniellales bacterium]